MGNKLKAGGMGSSVVATTPGEFISSMAAAIEDAYLAALAIDGKRTFNKTTNTENDRDRRRIFVAIAQGVVGYLKANADALDVVGSTVPSDTRIEIQTTP